MANTRPPAPPFERVMARVVKDAPSGCWLFTGPLRPKNQYGYISSVPKVDGTGTTTVVAHRVVFEELVGPIPEGLVLDHLCRVRHCVNPAHLEPVTDEENWRRGFSVTRINALKTHCKRGHEFTPENTRIVNRGRSRRCRTCERAAEAARRRRLSTERRAA